MSKPVAPVVALPPELVRSLSQRSTWRGALQLAVHLGSLMLSGVALWALWGTLWMVPLWLITGVLWNYLYAAQHELSHGTVFRSRKANEWWGRVIGFTQLYPRDYDRHHHMRHHRHTGDPDHDAELAFRTPYTLASYMMYVLGPSYWWGRVRAITAVALGRFDAYPMPPSASQRLALESRAHALLYGAIAVASVATGFIWIAALWLGPMLTTKWAHQLQNTVEHTGRPMVPDLLESTRTVKAPWLWRQLVWNMTYHTAHHSFPSVPFHRLPELHDHMLERGVTPSMSTYLGFQREVLARLARGYTV